jgi:membrane-bound inhibitor of C-type lysozyme
MIHNRYIGWATGMLLVVLATAALWLYTQTPVPVPTPVVTTPVDTTPKVLNTVTYLCDAGHQIQATFLERRDVMATATPDGRPVPTGAVTVKFDDTTDVTLNQTISADGARYANTDESLVVWNKGQTLMVLDHDKETTFTGCLSVALDSGNLPHTYASSSLGVTLRYPDGYTLSDTYRYTDIGTTSIPGVKLTIATATASGTNLSHDSYVSVESLPLPPEVCTADHFINLPSGATTSTMTVDTVGYSYATSSDAAAGNRYEEQVFVRPSSVACIAIRYFIHTTAIENYDSGTVQSYDRATLLSVFDAIRDATTGS